MIRHLPRLDPLSLWIGREELSIFIELGVEEGKPFEVGELDLLELDEDSVGGGFAFQYLPDEFRIVRDPSVGMDVDSDLLDERSAALLELSFCQEQSSSRTKEPLPIVLRSDRDGLPVKGERELTDGFGNEEDVGGFEERSEEGKVAGWVESKTGREGVKVKNRILSKTSTGTGS